MSKAVAAVSVAVILLTSCAETREASLDPGSADTTIAEADTESVILPVELSKRHVLQPDWVIEPQERDGVFVGPREREGYLEYVAIDSDGTLLWTARRPLACSGFVLTETSDGQAIAVLTDVDAPDGRLAPPTASAFDLQSGEPVWGPVEVTGPYKGPGLIYAAPPEGFIGDTGEKVALDPNTGDTLVAERDLQGERILGAHGAVVVTADESTINARSAEGDGNTEVLWSIRAADRGWDLQHVQNNTRHSWLGDEHTVLATSAESDAVVRVDTGEVIAEGVNDTGFDPATGMLIAVIGTETRGIGVDGVEAWRITTESEVQVAGIGNGNIFLRDGDRNVALDAATGEVAEGIFPRVEGDALVFLPHRPSSTGAAVVQNGQRQLLVTTAPVADSDRYG